MAKPFSFTYSKLKSYETCPRQHQAIEIDKLPGMNPSSEALDYGNRVHKALEAALKGEAELPPTMRELQYWVDHVNRLPGEKVVEGKWALRKDYSECEWFTGSPWLRYKCDVAVIQRDAGYGQLIDWKTGNRLEEPLQLWMGAAVMFQLFPELTTIDSMFVWLKECNGKNNHECISAETVHKSDVPDLWGQIIPRVEDYEGAVATGVFHPKPGKHCRWCRLSTCDFWKAAHP